MKTIYLTDKELLTVAENHSPDSPICSSFSGKIINSYIESADIKEPVLTMLKAVIEANERKKIGEPK